MNNVLPGLIDTYPADVAARATIPAGRLGTADEGSSYTYDANDRLVSEVTLVDLQFITTKYYYGNEGAHATPGTTTQLTSSERTVSGDHCLAKSEYAYNLRGRLPDVGERARYSPISRWYCRRLLADFHGPK
ncbi:MAG: hypothetical protein WDZ59_09680 [Pirellulales bacterium]